MPINQRLTVVQYRPWQTRHARSCLAIGALFALAALLAGWPNASNASSPPAADLVQAELVAEPAAVKPGEPFWVGLRLRIKDHWHVYWRNPGDSGEAPTITWQLPPGFAAGPIAWPTPQRIPVAHLANFGYERETTLLTRITPPAELDGAAPVDHQSRRHLAGVREGMHSGRGEPVAQPARCRPRRRRCTGRSRRRHPSMPRAGPCRNPRPGARAWRSRPDRLTLQVDAKGLNTERRPLGLLLPQRGDAGAARRAAAARGHARRARPAPRAQRAVDGRRRRMPGACSSSRRRSAATTAKQAFELANVAHRPGRRAARGRIARRGAAGRWCSPSSAASSST